MRHSFFMFFVLFTTSAEAFDWQRGQSETHIVVHPDAYGGTGPVPSIEGADIFMGQRPGPARGITERSWLTTPDGRSHWMSPGDRLIQDNRGNYSPDIMHNLNNMMDGLRERRSR